MDDCESLCSSHEIRTNTIDSSFGRRIYVHRSSFEFAARHDGSLANEIYMALVGVVVAKLAYHDLVQGPIILQAGSSKLQALGELIATSWTGRITELLQSLAYRSVGTTPRDTQWQAILTLEENVFATCIDSNYYTFATTDAAARRMYADFEKMSEVRRKVREKQENYLDLCIVTGDELRTINATSAQCSSELDAKGVVAVKQAVGNRVRSELQAVLESAKEALSDAELELVGKFLQRCLSTVCRVVLAQ